MTAIDAVRTLARQNSSFYVDEHENLNYSLKEQSPNFKIVMHSRGGLLSAVRFHLADTHLSDNALLCANKIDTHKRENNGLIFLYYLFQKDFRDVFLSKDPVFMIKSNILLSKNL